MANLKISAASDPVTLVATDKLPMARAASTTAYAATVAELAAFANGAYTPNYAVATPSMDGGGTAGTASTVARGDHQHPSDSSKASVASVPVPATTTPLMDGTAAVGTSAKFAREDHRHGSDTSRLPIDGTIAMTGPLTLAADPAADMQATTRQYVDAEIAAHVGGGVTAIYYAARSTVTSATDPGSGHVGFNTAAQGTATELYISGTSSQSVDWTLYWRGIAVGTRLVVQRQTDSSIVARFTLTGAAVDHGGWLTLPVTPYGTPAGFPVTNNLAMIVAVVTVGGSQFVSVDGVTPMTGPLTLPGSLFPYVSVTANGATALNWLSGEVQRLSLTGNATISVTNWPATGKLAKLVLDVTNTGAFNITGWPAGTIWPAGVAPTITSGAGKRDTLMLMTYDGGTSVLGSLVGQDYR